MINFEFWFFFFSSSPGVAYVLIEKTKFLNFQIFIFYFLLS